MILLNFLSRQESPEVQPKGKYRVLHVGCDDLTWQGRPEISFEGNDPVIQLEGWNVTHQCTFAPHQGLLTIRRSESSRLREEIAFSTCETTSEILCPVLESTVEDTDRQVKVQQGPAGSFVS